MTGVRVPRVIDLHHVVVYVVFLLLILHSHRVIERSHRFAFAEDLQRHSLPDVALRTAVPKQRPLLAHHVEEAGRDRLAVNIPFRLAPAIAKIPDRSNRVSGLRVTLLRGLFPGSAQFCLSEVP